MISCFQFSYTESHRLPDSSVKTAAAVDGSEDTLPVGSYSVVGKQPWKSKVSCLSIFETIAAHSKYKSSFSKYLLQINSLHVCLYLAVYNSTCIYLAVYIVRVIVYLSCYLYSICICFAVYIAHVSNLNWIDFLVSQSCWHCFVVFWKQDNTADVCMAGMAFVFGLLPSTQWGRTECDRFRDEPLRPSPVSCGEAGGWWMESLDRHTGHTAL